MRQCAKNTLREVGRANKSALMSISLLCVVFPFLLLFRAAVEFQLHPREHIEVPTAATLPWVPSESMDSAWVWRDAQEGPSPKRQCFYLLFLHLDRSKLCSYCWCFRQICLAVRNSTGEASCLLIKMLNELNPMNEKDGEDRAGKMCILKCKVGYIGGTLHDFGDITGRGELVSVGPWQLGLTFEFQGIVVVNLQAKVSRGTCAAKRESSFFGVVKCLKGEKWRGAHRVVDDMSPKTPKE